jgi:hypothetical protein
MAWALGYPIPCGKDEIDYTPSSYPGFLPLTQGMAAIQERVL